MSRTVGDYARFERVGNASYESARYRYIYRGHTFTVTRLTDPNADGGSPETRWDACWGDRIPGYGTVVVECVPTRRAAVAKMVALIRRHEDEARVAEADATDYAIEMLADAREDRP